MVTVYIYSHYFCLASSPLLSPPTTSTPYLTLCLAAAAHCFHLCLLLLFGRLSPLLSSPLLSSLLPMMKVSKSRTYLEYKLMIMNLWGTWHHYPSPLLSCLVMLTVFGYAHCLYDSFMLQVLDQMMIGMFLRPPPPLLLLIYYYSPSVIYGSSCCLPKKWAYLNTVSICMLFLPTLLSSLLFCQWLNCPTPEIVWIWTDDHELVRNLASLPAAPTFLFGDAHCL